MRTLSASELSKVAGGELQQYFDPKRGHDVTVRVDFVGQRDGSTDIHLRGPSGNTVWSQNTGVGVGCFLASTGLGGAAGILSRNPRFGASVTAASAQGCNAMGRSSRAGH